MLKHLEREDRHGVLMRGIGRWLVYSRARAWFGMAIEFPCLLSGVKIARGGTCLDIATGMGWASLGLVRRDPSVRIVALDYDGTILPRRREYLRSHGAATNTVLCRADAKQLPFCADCFDLVLCVLRAPSLSRLPRSAARDRACAQARGDVRAGRSDPEPRQAAGWS